MPSEVRLAIPTPLLLHKPQHRVPTEVSSEVGKRLAHSKAILGEPFAINVASPRTTIIGPWSPTDVPCQAGDDWFNQIGAVIKL